MINGTVQITGPIAPTSSGDTYPTHDQQYGLDGLRNVSSLAERNAIDNNRRRTGMVVGVTLSGVTTHYKLNEEPWTGGDSDWSELTAAASNTSTTYKVEFDIFPDGDIFPIVEIIINDKQIYFNVSGDCSEYDGYWASAYVIGSTENDRWYYLRFLEYNPVTNISTIRAQIDPSQTYADGYIVFPTYQIGNISDKNIVLREGSGDFTDVFLTGETVRVVNTEYNDFKSNLSGLRTIEDVIYESGSDRTTIKTTIDFLLDSPYGVVFPQSGSMEFKVLYYG